MNTEKFVNPLKHGYISTVVLLLKILNTEESKNSLENLTKWGLSKIEEDKNSHRNFSRREIINFGGDSLYKLVKEAYEIINNDPIWIFKFPVSATTLLLLEKWEK